MNKSSHIAYLLKMITDRIGSMITRYLAEDAITATQGRVLLYLTSRDGENVSQKDVEQFLSVTHTTAKGIVKRLEEKGLITTAFDNEDGRVKNIYLTEKSRLTHKAVQHRINSLTDIIFRGFSTSEKKLLTNLLQRLHDNII